MKQKIFFRADADSSIGYGHFVRTLALADILKDNFDCIFFTQTPSPYQRQEIENVCRCYPLPSDETRFDKFIEYLMGDEIVVLDNYFFTTEYQQVIKNKGCKLVCIDDLHDKHYLADIVINPYIINKDAFSIETYTTLCLGLQYTLLRKPFLQTIDYSKKEKDHWLIAFGGTDYNNLTSKFVQILQMKGVSHISVLLGDSYKYSNTLQQEEGLTLYKNLSASDVAQLMQRCEYAILPTSGICMEALSQGCKVWAGYFVDNQQNLYSLLASNLHIIPLGDLNIVNGLDIDKEYQLRPLSHDFHHTHLLYNLIFNSLSNPLYIDDLTFVDYTALPIEQHKQIWAMRNDERIRLNMDSMEIIPWEQHCFFVQKLFSRQDRKYWAVYINNILIGSVNILYLSQQRVERGIYVNPQYLGNSLGSKIELATEKLLKKLNINEIIAKVLHTNLRSLKFHYKNGYNVYENDNRYAYLLKLLNYE